MEPVGAGGIELVLPPLTQLNTPYPSISYLARSLRSHGIASRQRDLGIELALRVYSRVGLHAIFDAIEAAGPTTDEGERFLAQRAAHEGAIDALIAFLQGRDRAMARRILQPGWLHPGPRLAGADLSAFGDGAIDDAARHVATLYLADLADLVASEVDEGFALHRYHHRLAASASSFEPLLSRLAQTTLLDGWLDELANSLTAPVVALSVPFPGNLYGALRIGRRLRARGARVVMGGGYVNTELREVNDPRLWDFVDALCYDGGELPLRRLLELWQGGADQRQRTRTRDGLVDYPGDEPPAFAADYGDLHLDSYLQVVDSTNPAHRLWGDGRWNKITLAHGCYWKKCSFCDTKLDYISRFVPAPAASLVDAVEDLVRTTGQRGFHFVDEAAPPAAMRRFAETLTNRDLAIAWWGNIRFEAAYTPELCKTLAGAGLVAVTGGLEVASDRLLARMQKGVTIEQVARAAANFTEAGVLVHAYLMYGFPTQTLQETVDSAEIVRQLFAEGVLHSAFWHRFVLTRHADVFAEPERYRVVPHPAQDAFAQNDVAHDDPQGANHDAFDEPLPRMLAAWMAGDQLDRPVHTWFSFAAPPTTEPPDRVANAIST